MRYEARHVIHMLVSICARLESRVGLIRSRSPESFDSELGRIAAHLLYVTSEGVGCAWLASDVVHRYCSHGALFALSRELELLGADPLFSFHAPEPRRVAGHPGSTLSGRVSLRGVFAHGAMLGWRRHWCPFVGQAALTWFEVLSRHPSHETWEAWTDELLIPDLHILTH